MPGRKGRNVIKLWNNNRTFRYEQSIRHCWKSKTLQNSKKHPRWRRTTYNESTNKVRIGRTTGSSIHTNIGVPQGDCLSPVLFTLYLAAALKASIPNQDHTYTKPAEPTEDLLTRHLQDHTYATTRDIYVDINQQYADDISWATNAEHKIEKIKKTIPSQLKNYNLHLNESKQKNTKSEEMDQKTGRLEPSFTQDLTSSEEKDWPYQHLINWITSSKIRSWAQDWKYESLMLMWPVFFSITVSYGPWQQL